jgi:dihydrofolate synthase/folylpolyglutamate synthase
VFAAIRALGARPLIAEHDFTWRRADGHWAYRGPQLAFEDLPPSALSGAIQYRNAATALAALEALAAAQPRAVTARARTALARLDAPRVAAALRHVRLAGRFQIVPGAVEWILDIAHNEPAARVLAAQLRERPPPRPEGRTLAVIGVLADKDARAIAATLESVVEHFIACALPGARGGSAAALAARLGLPAGRVSLADSVVAGCERAAASARAGDRVVVCGSLFTVGPALEWLRIYSAA